MELLIVTGLSGAGKSLAMNVLEDIGYFCIDNIPAGLMPLVHQKGGQGIHLRCALIVVPVGIAQQFVLFRNIPGLAAALAHQIPHIFEAILFELSADDILLPEAVGCAHGHMAEQSREQFLL